MWSQKCLKQNLQIKTIKNCSNIFLWYFSVLLWVGVKFNDNLLLTFILDPIKYIIDHFSAYSSERRKGRESWRPHACWWGTFQLSITYPKQPCIYKINPFLQKILASSPVGHEPTTFKLVIRYSNHQATNVTVKS